MSTPDPTGPPTPAAATAAEAGRPPLPEPSSEPRSPAVRSVLFSTGGVASTLLGALIIEVLANIWSNSPLLSPIRTYGWLLIPLLLFVVFGWMVSRRAEALRQRDFGELAEPLAGPTAPARPNWSPVSRELSPGTSRMVAHAVEKLEKHSMVLIDGQDLEEAGRIVDAVAAAAMSGRSPGPPDESVPPDGSAPPDESGQSARSPESVSTEVPDSAAVVVEEEAYPRVQIEPSDPPRPFRAARFDLRSCSAHPPVDGRHDPTAAYAAAAIVLPAFGLRGPDCSEASLGRAARRLVDALCSGPEPVLLVLDHVVDATAVDWLLPHWPAAGAPPWLVVSGRDLTAPEAHDTLVYLPDVQPPLTTETTSERVPTEVGVLLRTLGELPWCEYGADAIAAVHAAISPALDRPLLELLTELRRWGLLECSATARYRLTVKGREHAVGEIDWPRRDTPPAWPAALPAVLHHYADRSAHWLTALRSTVNAATAAHWFRLVEPTLRTLVTDTHPGAHRSAIDDLTRIADALDEWYAREGQPARSVRVIESVHRIATQADYPVQRRLAEVRIRSAARLTFGVGPLPSAPRATRKDVPDRKLLSALRAREQHESGLTELDNALQREPTDRAGLHRAEESLRMAWLALPRADVSGEVSVLVNLAVAHLHQGRFGDARDRLDLADALTRRTPDPSGRAHVTELQGTVAWATGERHHAIRMWLRALGLYCELEESDGESRCLQHLGTVVLSDPALAGLVLVADDSADSGGLDEQTAYEHVRSWLQRSRMLRPDQPDAALVETYLADVTERLRSTGDQLDTRRPRVARSSDPAPRRRSWPRRVVDRLEPIFGRFSTD